MRPNDTPLGMDDIYQSSEIQTRVIASDAIKILGRLEESLSLQELRAHVQWLHDRAIEAESGRLTRVTQYARGLECAISAILSEGTSLDVDYSDSWEFESVFMLVNEATLTMEDDDVLSGIDPLSPDAKKRITEGVWGELKKSYDE